MVLSFIAPILFGWLYDWNYEYMIIIGSGFLVIAMVLCLGILEEEKTKTRDRVVKIKHIF